MASQDATRRSPCAPASSVLQGACRKGRASGQEAVKVIGSLPLRRRRASAMNPPPRFHADRRLSLRSGQTAAGVPVQDDGGGGRPHGGGRQPSPAFLRSALAARSPPAILGA